MSAERRDGELRARRCPAGPPVRRAAPRWRSAYLAKLVRDDELREAGAQMAAWYAAYPTYVEDALTENAGQRFDEAD